MPLVKPSKRWPLRLGEKYDHYGRIICPHNERRMHCATCIRYRKEQWEARNPDTVLQSSLNMLGIGVTVEWYRAKEAEQQGLCAICRQPETEMRNGKVKRLSVDHDHDTGESRALLCNRCNKTLGILETLDSEWKVKAEAYLACYVVSVKTVTIPQRIATQR